MLKQLLTFAFVAMSVLAYGQRTCASHEHHVQQLKTNETYRLNQEKIEDFTTKYVDRVQNTSSLDDDEIVYIPIVFHIVHNGDPIGVNENISDALVYAQIDQLNLDYRANNPDRVNIPAEFAGLHADTRIQFCLASVDPAGNETTGIIRWEAANSGWDRNAIETQLKPETIWDRDSYLNFWSVQFGGDAASLLGYAQFPGGPANTDGVVCRSSSIGSVSNPNPNGGVYGAGRTGTHEVGHWLNLRHIWGDDGGACTGSDLVADTPNQANSSNGSPIHPQVSCNTNDMFMNYMDYVNDTSMYMFTTGQSNRARALFEAGGSRVSLLNSNGCGNGNPDPDPGVSCPNGDNISLSLTTDNYGSETSWQIKDANNNVVLEGSGYSNNTSYGETACLAQGCYTLETKDTYGDGICCSSGNGSFVLRVDGTEVYNNGEYGSGETIEFCVADPNADNQAPTTPGNLVSTSQTYTTIVLSWSASTDNVGVTGYNIYQNGELLASNYGNTTATITDLQEATSYTYVITASDAAGNESEPASLTVSTDGDTSDTTRPSTPSGLTASNITATTATLSWTGSTDNVGVTGYNIYQDGTKIGNVTATTANLSGLTPNTTYTYVVTAFDAAGNESFQSLSKTILTDQESTGGGASGDVTVNITTDNYGSETSWNVTDASGATVMSGNGYSSNQTYTSTETLAEGCYTFTITDSYGDGICCTNGNGAYEVKVGNTVVGTGGAFTSNDTVEFCVGEDNGGTDTTAPSVPTGLASSNITPRAVTLTWNASTDNEAVTGYNVYQNGNKVAVLESTTANLSGLTPNTTYLYRVTAFDAAGNESSQSTAITVTTLEESTGGESGDVTVNITTDNYGSETSWNVTDASGATVMSGNGYSSNNSYSSTESLAEGCYTFTITDSYGDGICCSNGSGSYEVKVGDTVVGTGGEFTSNDTVEFCVGGGTTPTEDTEAPTIPIGLVSSNVSTTSLTLSWSASTDNVGVTGYNVYQNGTKLGDVADPNANLSNLTPNTTYSYRVTAFDAAGNESSQSVALTVTTLEESTGGNSGDVTVTLTTDNYASETTWKVTDASGTTVMSNDSLAKNQTYTSTESLAEGCYTFTITDSYGDGICCSNGSGSYEIKVGNTVVGSGGEFTSTESVEFCVGGGTTPTEDTQAPTVPTGLVASNVTTTTATLTWSASSDDTAVAGYNVYQNGTKLGEVTATTANLSSLTPGTTYVYTVSAFDAAGNESSESVSVSVTTEEETTGGGNSGDVTVNITTDNYGSETTWKVTDVSGATVMSGNGYSSNNTYTSTESLEAGCYTFTITDSYGDGICCSNGNGSYEVKVGDTVVGSGGQFTSNDTVEFCVEGGGSTTDTQAPTVPTGLASSNVTSTSLTLSWSASSDNTGVTGYNVYQDGVNVGTVTGTSVDITDLAPNTTNTYSVSAFDAAGNESAQSAGVTVTTDSDSTGGSDATVTVNITTDQYGSETSWKITDASGTTVMSGNGYAGNNSYSSEEVLASGCYTFTITDTYGDGMCCTYGDGSYEVLVNGVQVANGGQYTSSEAKDFCTTGGSFVPTYTAKSDLSNRFEVLPNTVTRGEQVTVSALQITSGTYNVQSVTGQTVLQGAFNGQKTLSTTSLDAGLYFISVSNGEKVATKKFMVK